MPRSYQDYRIMVGRVPTPGVERIPVARDTADDAFRFSTLLGRERRKVEPCFSGIVEHQLGQSAGAGDDRDCTPARPAPADFPA